MPLSDVLVATVVTGVSIESAESAAAKPLPTMPQTLRHIVDELKRELGIASEASIPTAIDAACAQLGVDASGGLVETAQRCWRALHGSRV